MYYRPGAGPTQQLFLPFVASVTEISKYQATNHGKNGDGFEKIPFW
jgi:hypothetical protein